MSRYAEDRSTVVGSLFQGLPMKTTPNTHKKTEEKHTENTGHNKENRASRHVLSRHRIFLLKKARSNNT